MNLVETITNEHSKAQCDKIVKYIGCDRSRFAQLVKVFLSGPYRITQRAAWPLSYCVELHPELVRPSPEDDYSKSKKARTSQRR